MIGDRSRFPERLQEKIRKAEELMAGNSGLVLNIAANYGGRWDITQAAQTLALQVQQGTLLPENITEESFTSLLSTAGLPDVDLLIRTGGDHRISNFLLWQLAYAELYFTPVLWPDFDEQVFSEAIASFANRDVVSGVLVNRYAPCWPIFPNLLAVEEVSFAKTKNYNSIASDPAGHWLDVFPASAVLYGWCCGTFLLAGREWGRFVLRDRPHRSPLGVLLALTLWLELPHCCYLVLLDLWCRLSSMLGLSGGVSLWSWC